MKVILMSELPGKGGEGDVIEVADGYANNFLLPQKIAIQATKGNLKQLEQRRANIAKREAVRVADATKLKEALDGKAVRVEATVGDEGVLFGSVTAVQIVEAIKAQLELDVDRRRVVLNTPIKTVGTREVAISLYRDIVATVAVSVDSAAGFKAQDEAAAAAAPAKEDQAEQADQAEPAAE